MFSKRLSHSNDRLQPKPAGHGIPAQLTRLIVCVCVGAFALTTLLDLLRVVGRPQVYSLFGLSSQGLFHKLWLHQLVTAPLLHDNVIHLAFNMLALWMLGRDIEQRLGTARYLALSVVSALLGAVAFLFVDWGGTSVALGYSAVIFGLLLAEALFQPDTPIIVLFFFRMKIKYAVLLLGAIELYLSVSSGGGPANVAHLFGAIGALVFLKGHQWWGFSRKKPAVTPRRRRRWAPGKPRVPNEL